MTEPLPPPIERVAVLGAGTMGAALAAHCANAGLGVLLLDVASPGADPAAVARAGLARAWRARPPAFFTPRGVERVAVGDFDHDLARIATCDWVVEAVVEDLDVKRALLARAAANLAPHALLTSNTSGLSAAALAAALPADVRPRFLVTHFFNPPRYLHLVELVAAPATGAAHVARFEEFADRVLGKGVVHAKDTPNFVANRIGCHVFFGALRAAARHGLTVAEVDVLTGELVGRPKSATFRTADMVGLDTLVRVAENLKQRLGDDAERALFEVPDVVARLVAAGRLGEKSGGGFYRRVAGQDGRSAVLALDLATFEYAPTEPVLPLAAELRDVPDLAKRLRALVAATDRAGAFVWETLSGTLRYAAACVPEVADDLLDVDRALAWGFGWELGPFATWDALGFRETAERMVAEGHTLPPLARRVYDAGGEGFLRRERGRLLRVEAASGRLRAPPPRPGRIVLDELRVAGGVVAENADAALLDLGDDVLCLEFRTKRNTLGPGLVEMLERALDVTEARGRGLVLGNDGPQWCAGANLYVVLRAYEEGGLAAVARLVDAFQRAVRRVRFARRPVVAAPHGAALGGGCELLLAAHAACAAAETYAGLVEVSVGLVPAGGGCTALLRAIDESVPHDAGVDLLPLVRRAFETVGGARVSSSAAEARELGFLRPGDRVTLNRERVLADAKALVLALDAAGFAPPRARTDIRVVGEPGLAALTVGLDELQRAGRIDAYERVVGGHLAHVLAGGPLTAGARVSEEHLLALEKQAFLALCGDARTRDRMLHFLRTGRPLGR